MEDKGITRNAGVRLGGNPDKNATDSQVRKYNQDEEGNYGPETTLHLMHIFGSDSDLMNGCNGLSGPRNIPTQTIELIVDGNPKTVQIPRHQ